MIREILRGNSAQLEVIQSPALQEPSFYVFLTTSIINIGGNFQNLSLLSTFFSHFILKSKRRNSRRVRNLLKSPARSGGGRVETFR